MSTYPKTLWKLSRNLFSSESDSDSEADSEPEPEDNDERDIDPIVISLEGMNVTDTANFNGEWIINENINLFIPQLLILNL